MLLEIVPRDSVLMNGLIHHFHLGESNVIFSGGISSDIDFFNGVAITSQLSVAKKR